MGDRLECGAQCRHGSLQILGHLDVGNIQSFATFVEQMRNAILWQQIGDLQPGGIQSFSQAIFIFKSIEAPQGRAALFPDTLLVFLQK